MVLCFILGILLLLLIICEKLYESTNHYHNYISQFSKFKTINTKFDYINTGSTFAYYGLNYNLANVQGLNLALKPQSLKMDFVMLKHFRKYYNDGAIVYIVISDLAFCLNNYSDSVNNKYYNILDKTEIPNYSFLKHIREKYFPVLHEWKNCFRFLKDVMPDESYQYLVNPNDEEWIEADANKRCESWCTEFQIDNMRDVKITPEISKAFISNQKTVTSIIEWCLHEGLNPIIVNLPITNELKACFSNDFLYEYYYKNILSANKENVPFIDFFLEEKLSYYFLYVDSARLNKPGREIITNIIIKRTADILKNEK